MDFLMELADHVRSLLSGNKYGRAEAEIIRSFGKQTDAIINRLHLHMEKKK